MDLTAELGPTWGGKCRLDEVMAEALANPTTYRMESFWHNQNIPTWAAGEVITASSITASSINKAIDAIHMAQNPIYYFDGTSYRVMS